jgi:hypothetical protein
MKTFSNAIACTSVRFELFDPAEAGAEVRPVIATQRKGVGREKVSPSRRAWSSPPAISPASSPRSHCTHAEEAANYAVRGLSNIYDLTSTISIWCGANELAGDAHPGLPTNSRSVVTRGRSATGESESRGDSPRRDRQTSRRKTRDRAESGQAGDSQTAARVDPRCAAKRLGVASAPIQHHAQHQNWRCCSKIELAIPAHSRWRYRRF